MIRANTQDSTTPIDRAGSSLDRMADLTRKILTVRKTALPKVKAKKRKKR